MVLRVAADVGIELTATCAEDLRRSSGERFVFKSADIARLKARVKFLDILNKAEGMDLVREIHQMPAEGQRLKPPMRIQRTVRLPMTFLQQPLSSTILISRACVLGCAATHSSDASSL